MKERIWLSPPHMEGHEIKYINEAFKTNWIAPLGPNVDGFENSINDFLGEGFVTVLSSGTAAIHLALIMAGVKPEDYIIASSFTFSGSINPIAYLGAKPILIDSEPDTWNMDPILLEKSIIDCFEKGIKPKAIILVHLYGMPAKLDQILNIASKYNIPIIEDAAEALGSSFKGKKLGTFGDYGILSFNGNKIITTSGGGALICKTKNEADFAKFLATQARDKAPHYQHSQIGYNYRMSNIVAGIGRGQIEVINKRVYQRRDNNTFYRRCFAGLSGISFLTEPSSDYHSNYWLTTILIEPEKAGFSYKELMNAFDKENIESRPLWKPMHLQPIFQNELKYTNNISENLFNKGLCLPSGSALNLNQKNRISAVISHFTSI